MTAPMITADNQLVIPDDLSSLTLAAIRPSVEQYKEINESLVFDYRSKEGNKQARSHVARLRKIKAPVEAVHKSLKAEYKAITDTMDKDKRELLQIVEDMISFHADPLKKIEEEEAAAAALERIRVEIEHCWDYAHEMNAMFDRQRELDRQSKEQERIAQEQAEKQREIDRLQREKEIAEKAAKEAREKAEAEAAANMENIKRVHRSILGAMVYVCGIDEEQAKRLILAIREGIIIPAVSIDYQWRESVNEGLEGKR